MSRDVHNGMNVINSRDVIARLAELEEWREDALTHLADLKARIAELEAIEEPTIEEEDERITNEQAIWAAEDGTEYGETGDWSENEHQEWKVLKALDEEASGYAPNWKYGEMLIRDSHFEDYARELAEDIGAVKNDVGWPACHIDWEAAAEALKQDYTSVDFDGVEYWVRS